MCWETEIKDMQFWGTKDVGHGKSSGTVLWEPLRIYVMEVRDNDGNREGDKICKSRMQSYYFISVSRF